VAVSLARRIEGLSFEQAFIVLEKVKRLQGAGRDVIRLEMGEPDYPTPSHVVEAGCRALRQGFTRYTPVAGIPELRDAIASDVARSHGVHVDPSRVVVTPGAKPMIFFSVLALVEPGDEVVIPAPAFPVYASVVRFAGGRPVFVPLRADKDFALDLDRVEDAVSERTRLVILNSPSNPTGAVLERGETAALAGILQDRPRVLVLSDEIYGRLSDEGRVASMLAEDAMADRTILVDGFSKAYSMTGWRLGYGVLPDALADAVGLLQVNSNSCANAAAQWAGLEALTASQDCVVEMRTELRARRRLLVDGLNRIDGISCSDPGAGFFAFPSVEGLAREAEELADLLLHSVGVACLPGTAFNPYGEGHLRLSCTASRERIGQALDRIGEAVRGPR